MTKDTINKLFLDFIKTENVTKAKEISEKILNLIDKLGLKPYEVINGRESIYVDTFNSYFNNFGSKPNPELVNLETIRLLVINSVD
jgi:hypothetical protein